MRFVDEITKMDGFTSLGGVLEKDINFAEQILNLNFSEEYRYYLLKCGIAMTDEHEFTGIGNSKRLNVVRITLHHREFNGNIPNELYVVEELGIDRITIWQSQTGEVFQTVAKDRPKKIAEDLVEYLEKYGGHEDETE